MKPIYIFAARLRALWVLLPMAVVLSQSIRFNDHADGAVKLYPLIICTVGAIIFTFIYYFRFIAISYSEIKYIGRFTTRDSATVNAGKTLVIEMLEKKRISIRLYGKEGYNPEIKWLTNEDGECEDICVFRGRAYGNKNVAIRILNHFGIKDSEDIDAIFAEEDFTKTYENVTVSTVTENEHKNIRIKFDKTV